MTEAKKNGRRLREVIKHLSITRDDGCWHSTDSITDDFLHYFYVMSSILIWLDGEVRDAEVEFLRDTINSIVDYDMGTVGTRTLIHANFHSDDRYSIMSVVPRFITATAVRDYSRKSKFTNTVVQNILDVFKSICVIDSSVHPKQSDLLSAHFSIIAGFCKEHDIYFNVKG